jgi:eukaryotic-like serine/threonine-protein kinase
LKPSNLFVMADDTVKIIDFGIVHLADNESRTGMKGTLPYMAPEQLELKSATPKSDIFSLGVVCYEALTGRKPFDRPTAEELVEAIRHQMPIPVSDLNPNVNEQLSRTVQKALAKQPYHRFSSTREFAEFLQRSLRNEPIELFDRNRIQPRLNRVKKALGTGDYQLAIDILNELESEGNIDSELAMLRMEGERAMRAKTIQQLLEDARTRMEEQEYPLALQKVQSVLEIDPNNIDSLAMRTEIERQRSSGQIEKWHQIAQQHLQNRLYSKARQAVDEILKIDSAHKPAREILAEISRCEAELAKLRVEKQQLYDSAYKAYRNGEISSALRLLERVVELGKSTPGQPNTDARYLEFYERVRRERDELASAYAEGKRALEARDCNKGLEICNQVLTRRPGEPLFQALKIEIEEFQRQQNSAAVATLHSQIEAEIDLERKFEILKEAVKRFPGEQTFQHLLKLVKERRGLVNSIVVRARHYETQRQFIEASNQWEILRSIYKNYPGLDYEIQRLSKKQEEYLNNEAKARLFEKIDNALTSRDYTSADELLTVALADAPQDDELNRLKQQVDQSAESSRRAQMLLEEGQSVASAGDYQGALDKLRSAWSLESNNLTIARALSNILVEFARKSAENDWRAALSLVEEALKVNPEDPSVAGVSQLISDMKHRERVEQCLEQARDLRRQGRLEDAIEQVELVLRDWPNETKLLQLRTTLRAGLRRNSEMDRTPDAVQSSPGPSASSGATGVHSSSNGAAWGATTLLRKSAAPKPQNSEELAGVSASATLAPSPESVPAVESEAQHPWGALPAEADRAELRRRRRDRLEEESRHRASVRKWFVAAAVLVIIIGVVLFLLLAGKTGNRPVAAPLTRVEQQPQITVDPGPTTPTDKAEPAPQTADKSQKSAVQTPPPPAQINVPEKPTKSALPRQQDLQSVFIGSKPAGLSVVIDGKRTEHTPITLQLSVGEHVLTFVQGEERQEQTIHVTEQGTNLFGFIWNAENSSDKPSPPLSQ